jgi:hypothetical protein
MNTIFIYFSSEKFPVQELHFTMQETLYYFSPYILVSQV